MTTEDGDDPMPQFDTHRPISAADYAAAPPPQATKPPGGARLLSFLLQAVVMVIALSLFFLFAGVAALVLLHLCVAGRAFRRRRRHSPADPALLSPMDLQALPCFDYPAAAGNRCGRLGTDCAVCLEGFREGELCRALPGCNHAFHMLCVDRWLVRSPACPICRGEVAAAEPTASARCF